MDEKSELEKVFTFDEISIIKDKHNLTLFNQHSTIRSAYISQNINELNYYYKLLFFKETFTRR